MLFNSWDALFAAVGASAPFLKSHETETPPAVRLNSGFTEGSFSVICISSSALYICSIFCSMLICTFYLELESVLFGPGTVIVFGARQARSEEHTSELQ